MPAGLAWALSGNWSEHDPRPAGRALHALQTASRQGAVSPFYGPTCPAWLRAPAHGRAPASLRAGHTESRVPACRAGGRTPPRARHAAWSALAPMSDPSVPGRHLRRSRGPVRASARWAPTSRPVAASARRGAASAGRAVPPATVTCPACIPEAQAAAGTSAASAAAGPGDGIPVGFAGHSGGQGGLLLWRSLRLRGWLRTARRYDRLHRGRSLRPRDVLAGRASSAPPRTTRRRNPHPR